MSHLILAGMDCTHSPLFLFGLECKQEKGKGTNNLSATVFIFCNVLSCYCHGNVTISEQLGEEDC